jgi:hypothetical protein
LHVPLSDIATILIFSPISKFGKPCCTFKTHSLLASCVQPHLIIPG